MDKENMIYINNVLDQHEILSFLGKWCNWRTFMLNETRDAQKNKYHILHSLSYVKAEKFKVNVRKWLVEFGKVVCVLGGVYKQIKRNWIWPVYDICMNGMSYRATLICTINKS